LLVGGGVSVIVMKTE